MVAMRVKVAMIVKVKVAMRVKVKLAMMVVHTEQCNLVEVELMKCLWKVD